MFIFDDYIRSISFCTCFSVSCKFPLKIIIIIIIWKAVFVLFFHEPCNKNELWQKRNIMICCFQFISNKMQLLPKTNINKQSPLQDIGCVCKNYIWDFLKWWYTSDFVGLFLSSIIYQSQRFIYNRILFF